MPKEKSDATEIATAVIAAVLKDLRPESQRLADKIDDMGQKVTRLETKIESHDKSISGLADLAAQIREVGASVDATQKTMMRHGPVLDQRVSELDGRLKVVEIKAEAKAGEEAKSADTQKSDRTVRLAIAGLLIAVMGSSCGPQILRIISPPVATAPPVATVGS